MNQLCEAITASGKQCQKRAMGGGRLCFTHAVGVPLNSGRPTLLNDDVEGLLVASLRFGNYLPVAVKAAGISLSTFKVWMKRGEEGEEPYASLRAKVDKARAEGQVRNVTIIARAAEKDWRAATWLLERQWPELWGGVSVKVRTEAEAAGELEKEDADPFAEFDELAERRALRSG